MRSSGSWGRSRRGRRALRWGVQRVVLLVIVCVAWAVALAGCAGGSRLDAGAASPEDFAFGVIIPAGLASSATTPPDQRTGALLEPACYLLASDGTLRAAFGRLDPERRLPPIVRRVSREQREELYRTLHASGLLAPNAAGQPVGDAGEAIGTIEDRANPQPVAAGTGMVGVWWSAAGRRRSFTILPVASEDARATSTEAASQATDEHIAGRVTDRSAASAWRGVEAALRTLRAWSWRDAGPTPLVPPALSAASVSVEASP